MAEVIRELWAEYEVEGGGGAGGGGGGEGGGGGGGGARAAAARVTGGGETEGVAMAEAAGAVEAMQRQQSKRRYLENWLRRQSFIQTQVRQTS